jgi:hypothetical protein
MLTGVKQSGKDVCGNYLAQLGYTRLAFADVLKEQLAAKYQLPIEIFHDNTLKEQPCCGAWTPRSLCIAEGTFARTVDANIWAKHVLERMKQVRLRDGILKIVITDCRYQNEIDIIQPDMVIRIERPGYLPWDEPDDYNNITRVDACIVNNGSIADLQKKIHGIVHKC